MKRDIEKPPKGVYRKSDLRIRAPKKVIKNLFGNWEQGWAEFNEINERMRRGEKLADIEKELELRQSIGEEGK